MTSKQYYTTLYQALLSMGLIPQECQAIAHRILCHYCQCDTLALMLDQPLALTTVQAEQLTTALQRLARHEPIQYILEEAPFLGRSFQVSPAVFIPRPETEELVDAIIQNNRTPGLRVLDIGTGSGCIAVTLQKELSVAVVDALDKSPQALSIAACNAVRWQAPIQCIQANILKDSLPTQTWDLIVSNPPYVRLSEKKNMQYNVLNYEPPQAIFVTDEQPLVFYQHITRLASQHLADQGKLYVEINEAFGQEVAYLFTTAGFEHVCVMQDLQGKDRWIMGTLAFPYHAAG